MESIAVIIPTYNERQNAGLLLPELKRRYRDASIIVVDGGSSDGTADEIRRLERKYGGIALLSNPKKEGLSTALQRGFRFALNHKSAEWIISMDADFSHDSADLERLVQVEEGAEMMIGSRYAVGGNSLAMGRARRFLSKLGNLYLRLLTGIPVRDITSGFVAYRRDLLRSLVARPLRTDGFSCQIEIKYRAVARRAKIKEIPIVFSKRRYGRSKFSLSILCEGFFLPWLLRLDGSSFT